MNKVEVFSLDARFKKWERVTKTTVLRTFKLLNKKRLMVEIFLAGDNLMRFLNYKFKNKKYPANVLSFPEPKDFLCFYNGKGQKIGEIFLNAAGPRPFVRPNWPSPRATESLGLAQRALGTDGLGLSREAKKWGELAALKKFLIHSTLHLLGYTHQARNDKIKMERLENKLLSDV